MANPIDTWERARRGKHTVVLGLAPVAPPQDLRAVRVSCDVPATTLGPLLEARSRIERILGTEAPLVEMARSRMMTGLRRHLLGDLPSVTSEGSLVDVCNRFAALGPSALVLEAADRADPASLDMLRHILGRPGWLRLPVVLVMRGEPLSPAAFALVEAVRASCGAEAVISAEKADESAPASPGVVAEKPAANATTAPTTAPATASVDLRALPADVLRVLRTVAIVGSGCETPLVAAALELNELTVLDALQRAADLGVPLEDRGEGRIHLPEGLVLSLRASILPSLVTVLHRRIAHVLAKENVPPSPAVPALQVEPEANGGKERPASTNAWEVMQAEPPSPSSSQRGPELEREPELERVPELERGPELETAREPSPVVDEAANQAAEEAVASARAAVANQAEEVAVASARAAVANQAAEEAAAARAAEDAAAHAAGEARRASDVAAEKDARARRAAEEMAARAVERAQREMADERRAEPAYYKPFTGEARPEPAVAERPARWASSRASETHAAAHAAAQPAAHAAGDGRVDDDARAARHLAAAGDPEAAIARYFEAAQKAAAAAAYPQAVAHAQSALALLERLPPTDPRRLLRAHILLEAGRVLWHGAGPDDSFTLPGALRIVESARLSLHQGDPPELAAEIATTIAGILYELGDLQSLTRALDELTSASRTLAEAGLAQSAARLFNDQAAVLIRLGDPVRAAHLLAESRKIFEGAAKTDPIAMVEMAETDHLFARILLHVPARPGREDDALSLGLDHALAAERAFRRLGAPREVGRVLETMGRLELRRGRLSRAADRITAAVQIQESVGDVMGLARSTAALSDVLAAGGRVREALSLLGDSIVLNFEKGSPLGVAFNRQSLEGLARNEAARASAKDLLNEMAARLTAAEKVLGRIGLPGQPDPQATQ